MVVKREQWPSTTAVIGTMEAVHGVMVSADLPGTVAKINFDSGKAVREGDVLVELDTRQERAQLAALEAQRDLAKINYGRNGAAGERRRHLQSGVRPGHAPSKSRPKRMWAKSAPPLSERPFARRFRECWGFARSISASICRPEARWFSFRL